MKIFKLSKDFPYTIYRDENLYYVWIHTNNESCGYLMCTSIYAIAYAVSYIEAHKYLHRHGSYHYAIFKGPSLKHYGYWGRNVYKDRGFTFYKYTN